MKDNFLDNLKQTLNEDFNESVTENGAFGYRTTGKELLDINFAVSSLRNASDEEIRDRFARVYYEDQLLAVKWLFFAGDVREGMGERRLFRIGMRYLAISHSDVALKILELVPEYTRWDNYLVLLDTPLCDEVCLILKRQLSEDMQNLAAKKPISLCAKWMPSVNAASAQTIQRAKFLIEKFGITQKEYRKTLSALRAYIGVVEVKMSAKRWSEIDYAAVPSHANLIYFKAFLRNDSKRRRKYLEELQNGETKINAGVLFPHDIVHRYVTAGSLWEIGALDPTLEELWKALPDYVRGEGSTICVADGSGSMYTPVGNTWISALTIANAIAIYFASRCGGQFKDNYITFSENPQLVDMSKCTSLHDKIEVALLHNEVANTNIEAVFDLILTTAVNAEMKQSDMPKNILILSDMEFDAGVSTFDFQRPTQKLFAAIGERYAEHGYKLPRLVFWNIAGRTNTVPVRENELGVALVSGFSPTILNMVLGGDLDPYNCLLGMLGSHRYDRVETALKA